MVKSKTISLTRASESHHINEVMKAPYTYDEQVADRCSIKCRFVEEKLQVKRIFEKKFKTLYQEILHSVDQFVEKSLDIKNQRMFPGKGSDNLFGATLNLNMRMSDHEPIFELIENNLVKYKNLTVTRIKVSAIRKRTLFDILEQSKNATQLIFIIEQAETLTPSLTDILMGNLETRLEDEESPTSVIMVMFCLSIYLQDHPFEQLSCFGRLWEIERDSSNDKLAILEEVVRGRGLFMKLGPKTVDSIYTYLCSLDSSIASIIYLFNHALFEHYYQLEDIYEAMNSSTRSAWHQAASQPDRHQYVCDQLLNLELLLRDYGLYPEDVSELYEDLYAHERLSYSTRFVDALKNLHKMDQEAILKRIDRVMERSQQIPQTKNGKVDVVSILASYRDKILNNKDCKEILSKLIDELLDYSENLDNLFISDKYHRYFYDHKGLSNASMTAVRDQETFMDNFCKGRTYFAIITRYLLNAHGSVGVFDLATDIEDEYKEVIRNERLQGSKKGPRIKVTPRKTGSRVPKMPASEIKPTQKGLSPDEEDGLVKALFVDAVDCLEHQLMVKLDAHTKGRQLKRLIWPVLGDS